ncbi:MAG: hypothetical protein KatS3mg052_0357 [Candidatus Roseilinea sp.]|nr:MAG: hypothetical protein KatS3mg052_0357 [Candidatus Roseilinea sp.]
MAYAVQWPLAALGIAGLLLSLLADMRAKSLMHIVPYELAIAVAIIGLWQSRRHPGVALVIVGWGAWGVALSFGLIHAVGAAMIGIAVACAAGIILIGPRAGWAMWAGAAVILAAHSALAAYPTPAQLAAVTIGAGLSTLLAHVVWRVLLRTLRWMQEAYIKAQTQSDLLRDKSAELALALKSLSQTTTQLARANEQLEISRQQAEEARRAKEAFAASVSHELRAPLNLIIGFSDLIMREPALYGLDGPQAAGSHPKLLADIGLIHRYACHLLALVNDILDLSQIESNRITLERDLVPVSELIQRAAAECVVLAQRRGLRLETHIEPNLPLVFADRTRVHQVLLNLLSNALRFTEAGGITLTARKKDEAEVIIQVADTGIGIAPDDLKRLFEPFLQLRSVSRRRGESSGLGLAISKQLIELHGGRIWAESTPGQGSTFAFTLPALPHSAQVKAERRPRSLTRREVGCLAVVEPTPLLTPLLARHIHGIPAVRFENLAALAEHSRADCPELIIVNEIAHPNPAALHPRAEIPNVPVIHCRVPGLIGQVVHRARVRGEFIRHCLTKPFTREQFYDAIRRLLTTDGHAAPAAADKRAATLLIVEDDQDMATLLSRWAHTMPRDDLPGATSLRVIKAYSGEEALDHLSRAAAVDGVLLDLELGTVSGFDVLAAMDRHDDWRRVPVCLISGEAVRGEYLATPYVSLERDKAFTARELMQIITELARIVVPGATLIMQ